MDASLIWYRARSDSELHSRLGELLGILDAVIVSENTTINPTIVPALLAEAIKNSDITVIVGGMDIRREDENIVTILSHCLALRLEEDDQSRSHYIYDTLRGKVMPTFESAVLFPSAHGGPEGMMLTAGTKTLLLLPWMEREQMDIISMMCSYIPSLLGRSDDVSAAEETPVKEKPEEPALPAYIEKAAAKHRAAAVRPDEELTEMQLKARLARDVSYSEPKETNRFSAPARSVDSSVNTVRSAHGQTPHRQQPQIDINPAPVPPSRRSGLPMRILIIVMMLAVIGASCYIAIFHYESGLLAADAPYQSELARLYTDEGNNSILPQFALPQFAQLYEKNPDTRGFLSIPGTDLSLPIVQTSGSDIDKYAELDFYGNADSRGTLYFDSSNTIKFGSSNSNLIVYGKSPADGSMFAQLKNYTNADFLSRHPIIQMDTLFNESTWQIFSVCIVSQNTVSDFNYTNTLFTGQDSREVHLHNLYIRSLFYTETQVFPTDDILTLVTDHDEFSGARLIVCARKLRADEDNPPKKISIHTNEQVIMPDIWYQLNGAQTPSIPGPEFSTSRDTITAPIITDENGDRVYVYESLAVTTTTTADLSGTSSPTTAATTLSSAAILPDMRITAGGKVITGPAAEVLAMIVEAEMGSDFEPEALKAQAIAAYTFYLYSGGSAKAPSFSTKTPGEKALAAANAVAGIYMTYKGTVPYTPYFPISAGRTADNSDINGSELSYLVSVDCSIDETVSGYCTVKELTSTEVARRVLEKKGIDLTAIADKNEWFHIIERDPNGLYVTEVTVGGHSFRGNTLHLSILGYTCLRSPCFTIEYDADGDKFVFTSYGYGSGVGMSQSAANEYAKQGYDHLWILRNFYTGVEFSNS